MRHSRKLCVIDIDAQTLIGLGIFLCTKDNLDELMDVAVDDRREIGKNSRAICNQLVDYADLTSRLIWFVYRQTEAVPNFPWTFTIEPKAP